jgi:hypothetical protein
VGEEKIAAAVDQRLSTRQQLDQGATFVSVGDNDPWVTQVDTRLSFKINVDHIRHGSSRFRLPRRCQFGKFFQETDCGHATRLRKGG